MDQTQSPVNVVVQQQPTNSLGLAGLVLSIIGWLTCGLLCIPGAFVSFLGLFSKAPKGLAIAGLSHDSGKKNSITLRSDHRPKAQGEAGRVEFGLPTLAFDLGGRLLCLVSNT